MLLNFFSFKSNLNKFVLANMRKLLKLLSCSDQKETKEKRRKRRQRKGAEYESGKRDSNKVEMGGRKGGRKVGEKMRE